MSGTHRIVLKFPAKELRVKTLRGFAIAGAELHPTKISGLDFGCLLHSCFAHLDQILLVVRQICRRFFNECLKRGETFCFWKEVIYHVLEMAYKAEAHR